METEMQLLMARVTHLGEMSEAEARRIVNDVYRDGIVSRKRATAPWQSSDEDAYQEAVTRLQAQGRSQADSIDSLRRENSSLQELG